MFSRLARKYLPLALILALVLTASFGSTSDVAAAGETGLSRAIAAQEAHSDALMAIDGVIGTAVGRGTGGGHIVLALTTAGGIPGIPGAVDGVIVRPYVTGEITALKGKPGGIDRTARFKRPVPIGVSTGHPDITAGTIGARVVGAGGALFALSNNHVYANQNNAALGDAVIQPGNFDGGASPADDIGTLSAFQEIFFDGTDNVIDAAIAAVATVDQDGAQVLAVGKATPSDGYGTPSSTTVSAVVGMDVMKYGRTTGQTKSQISGINAIVNVGYSGGTARFVNQVIVSGGKFSDGGDSGSLIVTQDGLNPVALLFAGSKTATIGNPIGPVLAAFGVSIDGSGPAPAPPDTGSISGTVTNSDGGATIDGATVTTGSGQSATTQNDGTYTITNIPVGTVSVTASKTGFATSSPQSVGVTTASDTSGVNFSLTAVVGGTSVTVDSVSYALAGGRNGTKHVLVTIALLDDQGNDVAGASVQVTVFRNGNVYGGATADTGVDGTVTFQASNAPPGTYTTRVDDVVADGLTWDGVYPDNSFDK